MANAAARKAVCRICKSRPGQAVCRLLLGPVTGLGGTRGPVEARGVCSSVGPAARVRSPPTTGVCHLESSEVRPEDDGSATPAYRVVVLCSTDETLRARR